MSIKVGFAGSVHGMTAEQQAAFAAFISENDISEFRTAGCVGADEDAAEVVCRQTAATIIVCRQRTQKIESPLLLAVAATATQQSIKGANRNKQVVDPSDVIVLAPKSLVQFGGTWRTFKYARYTGKRVITLLPDGAVIDVQHEPRRAVEGRRGQGKQQAIIAA